VLRRATAVASPQGWLLVGVVYLTALLLNSRRVWHFGPDSRFYLAWAYHYGGLSEADAGRVTYEYLNQFSWFTPYCYYACDTSDPTLSYDWLYRGPEGGLVAPRVLYPLLSAPFVRLFGPIGMLVVPLVAYTACVIMVMVLANRYVGRQWSALAGLAIIVPISVTALGMYAYTEALAMAFCLACVLTLPLRRASRPVDVLLFGAFLTLFGFTRQFHPIVVAGVGAAWLAAAVTERRLRNQWFPFLGVGVGLSFVIAYLQSLIGPGYSVFAWFLEVSGAQTVGGIPAALPAVIRTIVVGEVFTAGRDFGLVVVAVLATLGLVRRWRERLSHFTFGLLAGTAVVQVLNTTPSQNRYWAMAIPVLAVVATIFIADLFTGPVQRVPQARPAIAEPAIGEKAARVRAEVEAGSTPG